MVASNARAMLERENEMLGDLEQTVSGFAQQAVGNEANLFEAWTRELRGHQEINEELRGKDDKGFVAQLTQEIKILEGMRASITGNSDIDDYWRGHVEDDIAVAKGLLSAAS
jgi:hypothetical protein